MWEKFEESYEKKWKGIRTLIKPRKGKRSSIKERDSKRQKSIPEKIPSYKHYLLVSMIKPIMIRLVIHQGKVDLHYDLC